MDFEVAIIGAGPYGLAGAAYLRASGVRLRVFGQPMEFWQNQTPAGMLLASPWAASHIADPANQLTLDAFQTFSGSPIVRPIPRERFIEYGHWYQQQAVPDLDRRHVSSVNLHNGGFRLMLADGQAVSSQRVVIAAGIGKFSWRPPEFDMLPPTHASHSSEHSDLCCFRKKRTIVIGGGQSALDAARLLHDAESEVEVLVKGQKLNWTGTKSWLHNIGLISRCLYSPKDVGPAGLSHIIAMPGLFSKLPRRMQDSFTQRATRPSGPSWIIPRLTQIPITLDRTVVSASIVGSRVRLRLDDNTTRIVDHVLLATGYRVDISRYDLLTPAILKRLQNVGGYPVLGRGFESSVSGLHFLGKPAVWSYGPLLQFISGTDFASKELVRGISLRKLRTPTIAT